jgi:hypothetical protein
VPLPCRSPRDEATGKKSSSDLTQPEHPPRMAAPNMLRQRNLFSCIIQFRCHESLPAVQAGSPRGPSGPQARRGPQELS